MDLQSLATPELLADPYPFYERVRALGPVVPAPGAFGLGGAIVTGHAICSAVLRNKQFGKEGERVLAPEQLARIAQEQPELSEKRRQSMLFRDPPAHTRLRGLVSLAFTPRVVERLRPRIEEIADELIDRAAARGDFDLIGELAFPLPITVIAEMLGVPPADKDRFKAWSTVLTAGLNPGITLDEMAQVRRAVDELDGYLEGVVEERRREPRGDLISDLVRAQEAGDRLDNAELVATCRLLLTAGHETTVNLIGNGMLALLRDREQREALAADPSLLEGAIEELLRYDSPVQMTMRFAMEDAPLGPRTVRRGELVIVVTGAGNRDPEVFADPARLDLRRANAGAHLAFGAGIHYCLGAALARLEGQIAIGALLRRLPGLALAGGPLTWRRNVVLRGLQALPVRASG